MLGLSPEDIFDEAVANMITDGVEDLRNGCVKIYYEQDETKKVNNKCCNVSFYLVSREQIAYCVCLFVCLFSSIVSFAYLFLFLCP